MERGRPVPTAPAPSLPPVRWLRDSGRSQGSGRQDSPCRLRGRRARVYRDPRRRDVAVAGAGRPASPTLQVVVAPYRPVARFAVSYSGTGTWVTTYHATPPNPGGMHDTNDAADSSTERWSLDYLARLSVPVCGSPGRGRPDRCSHLVAPTLARGPTSVAGVVDHNHVDGLYRFDDAAAGASSPRHHRRRQR